LHGWLPPTVWAVAAVVLVVAIGWRSRRWRLVWLPVAVVVSLILAAWTHWYVDSQGMAGDPAPSSLWIWVGLTGVALAVAVLGWRHSRWRRRTVSLVAVPLCLLSAGVSLNLWVGYFPTVQAAWNELTAGPLPDATDVNTVMAMRGKGAPSHGALVPVTIPDDASQFKHRTELVYLPPAWFVANAPKLPYVTSTFGTKVANWGVVGWSMGGTCAVDLTVMHPELFSTFVDIAGDMGPNAGTKEQTIARIYGGDTAKWPIYDPTTVITKHGPYHGVSGWFAISSDAPTQRKGGYGNPDAVGLGGQDAAGNPGDQTDAANALCTLGRANGITCAVIATPGKHDWPFATDVFASSLPWLAGQLGTPDVPKIPLPGAGPAAGPSAAALPAATH
jgi:S-formylglutathione hydrolase FrmB